MSSKQPNVSLARNNVTYAVRLRTPDGRRVGFFNTMYGGELPVSSYVTDCRWSNMPSLNTLFEKETGALYFRKSLLDMHIREINNSSRHLAEQQEELAGMSPADGQYDGLLEYTLEEEKKLNDAIGMVPYIRDAEIVRIVVETM